MDAMTTRTTLIGLINEHLTDREWAVSDEVIVGVMGLSFLEVSSYLLRFSSGSRSMYCRRPNGCEGL